MYSNVLFLNIIFKFSFLWVVFLMVSYVQYTCYIEFYAFSSVKWVELYFPVEKLFLWANRNAVGLLLFQIILIQFWSICRMEKRIITFKVFSCIQLLMWGWIYIELLVLMLVYLSDLEEIEKCLLDVLLSKFHSNLKYLTHFSCDKMIKGLTAFNLIPVVSHI